MEVEEKPWGWGLVASQRSLLASQPRKECGGGAGGGSGVRQEAKEGSAWIRQDRPVEFTGPWVQIYELRDLGPVSLLV